MLRFDGRTAIVTGAGRGIGRAHAMMLAARGADVVVNDVGGKIGGEGHDPEVAQSVVDEINAADGGRAVASGHSVTDPEGAAAIVDTAIDSFGGLDIVINNAGIVTSHHFPETGLADLDAELDVHLKGSFNVTGAAWPHLLESDAGRVVLTTSCAIFGSPILASYGAAKGAVLGLGRSLATQAAGQGIRVNMIAPYAKTRMADPENDFNADARKEVETVEVEADDVFARLLPEDISAVAGFLCHESCDLNGEVIGAGGGRVARIFVAETNGFGKQGITPEDVAGNWSAISDESEFFAAPDIAEYTNYFIERVPPAA